MSLNNFKDWLISKKAFKERSARDVISRIRRAKRIQKSEEKPSAEFIIELEKNKSFLLLSISVRSQLRRAIKLLNEFNNDSLT